MRGGPVSFVPARNFESCAKAQLRNLVVARNFCRNLWRGKGLWQMKLGRRKVCKLRSESCAPAAAQGRM
jgi:hypothetical protein